MLMKPESLGSGDLLLIAEREAHSLLKRQQAMSWDDPVNHHTGSQIRELIL